MNIPVISDIGKYTGLAFGLRSYLSNRKTLEESKQIISTRLKKREKNFLNLVHEGIYGNRKSPYLKLLKTAGCEFQDIETLVNTQGIEATLDKLRLSGVYLSWEEFKGKKDVVRGSSRFQFKETDFDNHSVRAYYRGRSSGSRSKGTTLALDLNQYLDRALYRALMLAADNATDVPMGLWQPILPSTAGIGGLLLYWTVGKSVDRWFSPVTESQVESTFRDKLAMRYIIYGSRFWGAKIPKPEYVGLTEAVKISRWIADTRRQFGGCSLDCHVSPAVMVCQAAIENGHNISGTHFFVGGEPLTEAKRRQIEATGASVTPKYIMTEIGPIGVGCPKASNSDEVHLMNDYVALIQHNRKVEHSDITVNAFVFTTLLPSVAKIIFNVESDDYGVVETRKCGCLYEQMGFNQHLYNIRSFSKLTGSGMTIVGSDLIRILEEVLPGKYGGAPTDYQLLEEEDDHGQTHIRLIISPKIGPLDDNDVINTVLIELRQDVRGGRLAAGFWSQMKTLQVRRMYPLSQFGKIVTLYLMKKAESP